MDIGYQLGQSYVRTFCAHQPGSDQRESDAMPRVEATVVVPVRNDIAFAISQRDLNRRIRGFQKGCNDPIVIEAVTEGIP